jgi:hypothetical protein
VSGAAATARGVCAGGVQRGRLGVGLHAAPGEHALRGHGGVRRTDALHNRPAGAARSADGAHGHPTGADVDYAAMGRSGGQ